MKRVCWGIVGTNFVSGWFADAVKSSGAGELTGVYSRAEDTGRAFALKYGVSAAYTDYDQLLNDERVNSVYIASPNSLHEAQAIRALDAGKHVLVEKPAAPDARALERISAASARSGKVFLEAMRPAFDPAINIIEQGVSRLGAVRRAQISMCQYSSRYDRFKNGEVLNAFNPSLANAALMDIGVYCVFVCARLFGMPRRVRADSVFLNNGMEGAGALLLSYSDMQAVVTYSKINDSALPCEIQGEAGSLRFDRINAPTRLTILMRGGIPEEINLASCEGNMRYEAMAFSDIINNPASARDYARVTQIQTQIMDMARESAGIKFESKNG